MGIRLRPEHLVRRSLALSCAGCHQLSNGAPLGDGLTWPGKSLAFVHISERDPVSVGGGSIVRFQISETLTDHFLPHRKGVLEQYMDDACAAPVCRGPSVEAGAPPNIGGGMSVH